MPLKLKTIEVDGKTYAEIVDGNPAYTNDEGKVVGFDANHASSKITSLNGEAQSRRENEEAQAAQLLKFKGIDDPAAAIAALETVSALEAKDLIEAGKVEEIKAAAIRSAQEQAAAAIAAKDEEIATITADRDGISKAFNNELVGGNFARSTFIGEKLVLPPSVAQAAFAENFKVEDGKVVGYNPADGSKIYSPSKHGEIASFDEALAVMVNSHPDKDSIMKGRNQKGGGSDGEGGGGGGGEGTMTRAEFNAMSNADRAAAAKAGTTFTD